jgi:hypothetical protein
MKCKFQKESKKHNQETERETDRPGDILFHDLTYSCQSLTFFFRFGE